LKALININEKNVKRKEKNENNEKIEIEFKLPLLRKMNIKMRIAYEAMTQGKSIVELFFSAIEKTLNEIYKDQYEIPADLE
jgi:hypothetical protein